MGDFLACQEPQVREPSRGGGPGRCPASSPRRERERERERKQLAFGLCPMLAWPFVRILKHSSTTLVDHKSPPFANSEALQGRCVWHQEKGGAPRTRGSGLSGGSHAVSAPGSGFLFGMKAGLRREGQVLARLSRYRFGAPSNLGHVMFHLYYAVVCLLSLAPNQPNLCLQTGAPAQLLLRTPKTLRTAQPIPRYGGLGPSADTRGSRGLLAAK